MKSDEFSSYTGDKLVPQKSGYVLASTAALRLVPGAKPQPLHRVSTVSRVAGFATDRETIRTKSRTRLDQTQAIHSSLLSLVA
jgi:hypothetical protein